MAFSLKRYIGQHWRGELTLVQSFWINGVLAILLITLIGEAINLIETEQQTYLEQFLFLLPYIVLIPMITGWQAVGIWRSASAYSRNSGNVARAMWGMVAKLLVLIKVLEVGVAEFETYRPSLELLKLAIGTAGYSRFEVIYAGEGDLIVQGYVTRDAVISIKATLEQNPEIQVIQLNLRGGRIGEARRLRDIVESRQLITYTATGCYSACTMAFLAGRYRLLGLGAELRFHGASLGDAVPDMLLSIEEDDMKFLADKGISQDFIERAYEYRGQNFWVPSISTLATEGYITHLYSREKGTATPVIEYCKNNSCD